MWTFVIVSSSFGVLEDRGEEFGCKAQGVHNMPVSAHRRTGIWESVRSRAIIRKF